MRRSPPTRSFAISICSRAELLGEGDSQTEAVNLRQALAERAMPPRHALDVLIAFRMDVTKLRYENWDEVIHYCRYSAMPVGRFMLDVHGESTSTWAASDALCAGLQINNHLQDCGKDYSESQPRLSSARRAGRSRRVGRDARRGEIAGAAPAMPACARRAHRGPAQRKQIARRRGQGFQARAGNLRDPGFRRQDRRHAEGARSPCRAGASQQA